MKGNKKLIAYNSWANKKQAPQRDTGPSKG